MKITVGPEGTLELSDIFYPITLVGTHGGFDNSLTPIHISQRDDGFEVIYGGQTLEFKGGKINPLTFLVPLTKRIDPGFLMEMKEVRESVMEACHNLPFHAGYRTELETLVIMYDQAFEFLKQFDPDYKDPIPKDIDQVPVTKAEATPPPTIEEPTPAPDFKDTVKELVCKYNDQVCILTPRGFVFVHTSGRAYWVCLFHGKPRMYYWKNKKQWEVYQEPVAMDTIVNAYKMSIPDSHAELYHIQHRKITGSTEFPPLK